MNTGWSKILVGVWLLTGCQTHKPADGLAVEDQILLDFHVSKDYSSASILQPILNDINCASSTVLGKQLVLADQFHSGDTTEILLVPYQSNGQILKSSAYSDTKNRIILINPAYIREFTLKNTVNDTASFVPVLELMLLHEIGHFILHRSGSFDQPVNSSSANLGEQRDDTQPEFMTTVKKVELSADSLAIALVKQKLKAKDDACLPMAFDVERILPGMQFQLAGSRLIENFGNNHISFLRDPSSSHPNLELRITFMNYFLFPTDSLKRLIDDYIYNRTVAPVHRQEFNTRLFQGLEKKLPDD